LTNCASSADLPLRVFAPGMIAAVLRCFAWQTAFHQARRTLRLHILETRYERIVLYAVVLIAVCSALNGAPFIAWTISARRLHSGTGVICGCRSRPPMVGFRCRNLGIGRSTSKVAVPSLTKNALRGEPLYLDALPSVGRSIRESVGRIQWCAAAPGVPPGSLTMGCAPTWHRIGLPSRRKRGSLASIVSSSFSSRGIIVLEAGVAQW